MIGDLNQQVEIFGRTYDVQTELSDSGIRTEVFLGGKLVATREKPLTAAERKQGDLRSLIQQQHDRILAGVADRVEQYRERRELAAGVAAPRRRPAAAAKPERGSPARPPAESVDIGLKVRRVLERFRLRLGPLPHVPRGNAPLERVAEHVAGILQAPEFPGLRIDEQVRFNLLNDQLQSWLRGDRDPDHGRRIWSELRIFNDYLAEINNRAELAAFDRDLLAWALRRLESGGMTERVREHLSLIAGRDGELDRLLAEAGDVSDEVWIAELRRVLAKLEGRG